VIVRELIALFGIQLDGASVQRADAAYAKIRNTVKQADVAVRDANGRLRDARGRLMGVGGAAAAAGSSLAGVGAQAQRAGGMFAGLRGNLDGVVGLFGGVALLHGVRRAAAGMIDLASDAVETENVIDQSFEAQADQVRQWSRTMSVEVGRSEFTLRGFAATMGAMLRPMTGSSEAAAEMSTTIAKLAIDLASFFNTAESDALIALRAGLAGEAEPLRRFGVVLLDATLQEFAHAQGIRKKVQEMNVAEKTELRYQFILSNTVKAQGDAARTAHEYANASRAAKDQVKDLMTRIGTQFLPIGKRFWAVVRNLTRGFGDLARNSNLALVAIGALAASALVMGIVMLAPFLPAILAGAKLAAVLFLVGLAVDDIITFFRGGKSVIGEVVDKLFGLGSSKRFLDNWNLGLEEFVRLVREAEQWFSEIDKHFVNFLRDLPIIGALIDKLLPKTGERPKLEPPSPASPVVRPQLPVQGTRPIINTGTDVRAVAEQAVVQAVSGAIVETVGGVWGAMRKAVVDVFTGATGGRGAGPSSLRSHLGGGVPLALRAPSVSPRVVEQKVIANTTINASPKDAPAIGRAAEEGLGRALRDAKEALSEEVD